MRLPPELRCPEHAAPAVEERRAGELACRFACRCEFPVVRGIPRFVASEGYAAGFGAQWTAYRRTQLDSYTGTRISRDRLERCLGGSLEVVRGRSVLEAGCGAGRFSEVLLGAGARVFAFDLSLAVEANLENCQDPDHFVCQADVLRIPAAVDAFDFVVALGMVQHTPDPEATIRCLARHVRPGGQLVLDHYRPLRNPALRLLGQLTPRSLLRHALRRLPPERSLAATAGLARGLLPVHRLLWRRGPLVDRVRAVWRRVSPVFDYYDAYPQLGAHLSEWALLDTHDGLTDRYKHLRSVEQVASALAAAGLVEVQAWRGGNGVEARARKPGRPDPV